MLPTRRIPGATYRVQLNGDFGFADAEHLVDYLAELGVTDLYCSPILKARAGSAHGYDVVDPTMLNPHLGGDAAFNKLARRLQQRGMGLVLDIVPNHMAVSPENPAWMSVLAYGPASPFADWFDIQWSDDHGRGAAETGLLLPVLGKHVHSALADGELTLVFEAGHFHVRYFDWAFPLTPQSHAMVFARTAGDQVAELQQQAERLPPWNSPDSARAETRKAMDDFQQAFAIALQRRPSLHDSLQAAAAAISASPQLLAELLDQQVYRLRYWKDAASELSYRRFFDITDLIGIRVELPHVFRQTHKLILRLLQRGDITALRIDHIDGLADPKAYLHMLQQAAAYALSDTLSSNPKPAYVLVEKILEGDEPLDESWPVDGTTGYDFLNIVNELFVQADGLAELAKHQERITGQRESFQELVTQQKRRMADMLFGSEVNALLRELTGLVSHVAEDDLREALIAVSAELPVYRTYASRGRFSQHDRALLEQAFASLSSTDTVNALREALLASEGDVGRWMDQQRQRRLRFILRWQQLTGPLMAKGLEDTSLYQQPRLISLNEVGMHVSSLDRPRGLESFHQFMQDRQRRWPHAMNATSTHDTKRSEDVRARLNVLSEMPERWVDAVSRWMAINDRFKRSHNGQPVPDPGTELFLYQSALGVWPLSLNEHADTVERLDRYMLKAAREGKLHTNWLAPDSGYEQALSEFVRHVFDERRNGEFIADFQELLQCVAGCGAIHGLSQMLIKLSAPGLPDLYQGCELWDFSLVDPDNRRPVDYDRRRSLLAGLPSTATPAALAELVQNWHDGRIKLYITHRALQARAAAAEVFRDGEYIPLVATGARGDGLCAFARRYEQQWMITAVPTRTFPHNVAQSADGAHAPLGDVAELLRECQLPLPDEAPQRWRNVLTDEVIDTRAAAGGHWLAPVDIFRHLPCALLQAPCE